MMAGRREAGGGGEVRLAAVVAAATECCRRCSMRSMSSRCLGSSASGRQRAALAAWPPAWYSQRC